MTEPLPRPDSQDPGAAFAAVVALRRKANRLEVDTVVEAIRQGRTWAPVGEALGISAQAAHKKFAATVRARAAR